MIAPMAPGEPHGDPPADERPSWRIRAYVLTFLAVFAICGTFALEAWPFTAWRLFSGVRPAVSRGWLVTTVTDKGREIPIGKAGFAQQLMIVFRRDPSQQVRICKGWVNLARARGDSVTGVRIYRSLTDLRKHKGHRKPPPADRYLTFTCSADGSRITPISPPRKTDVRL
jgi:hypothetical protein